METIGNALEAESYSEVPSAACISLFFISSWTECHLFSSFTLSSGSGDSRTVRVTVSLKIASSYTRCCVCNACVLCVLCLNKIRKLRKNGGLQSSSPSSGTAPEFGVLYVLIFGSLQPFSGLLDKAIPKDVNHFYSYRHS